MEDDRANEGSIAGAGAEPRGPGAIRPDASADAAKRGDAGPGGARFRALGPNRLKMGAAAALVAAAAVGAGAATVAQRGRAVTLVALAPQPVASVKDGAMAAMKGDVAEIFGNKFVVQDASGRALVETGPRGDRGGLVAKGETVTVQGRFERGFLHAAAITHADGHVDAFGPPPPPRRDDPDMGPRERGPRPPV